MSAFFAQTWVQVLLSVVFSLVCYLLGCTNGAILISRVFFKDDVRRHGSGNAGLTNFYRTYGPKFAPLVILTDMLKMALAVLLGYLLCGRILPGDPVTGKYWAGLCCVLGHLYPVTERFKGGKGVLSGGTLTLLLGWKVALCTWGAFLLMFLLTRYVSLGSILSAIAFPVATALFYPGDWLLLALSAAVGGLLLFAHRGNIRRLLNGTERKFQFRVNRVDKEK